MSRQTFSRLVTHSPRVINPREKPQNVNGEWTTPQRGNGLTWCGLPLATVEISPWHVFPTCGMCLEEIDATYGKCTPAREPEKVVH